ncbi:MAG TPA: glycosyltransferase family 39 protein [Chthoniobacterales bacterium]|nr:glycosyltransferase family 39 protein [Chthoniobacterales bacterium]
MRRPQITSTSSFARRGADFFGMSGPLEFILAAVLFALLVVFNVLQVMHQKFDSDEPYHLHIIWGWLHGFVQYRDIFDNHMPLFHIMLVPIFALIGERATILYWMRFILLPMYFVAAWCTYQIGTRLFSRRAGIWALIAVGFFSGYNSDAYRFRTDSILAPIWLLCVTVLIGGAISIRRALVAGLFLGFCFGVSMKSVVLLLSLLICAPLALAMVGRKKLGRRWTYLLECAAVFLAAAMLIPGIIMIFFALKGFWSDLRYGVFDFNFLANRVYENKMAYQSHPAWTVMILAIALTVIVCVARWIIRVAPDPDLSFRRVFTFLVCACYLLTLRIFWPPISRTYPPIYPLAFVILTAALLALSDKLVQGKRPIGQILGLLAFPGFVALGELSLLLATHPIWKDSSRQETDLLRRVLALTEPDDYVLDCKGETIFRRRCFRPLLERITMESIEQGIIKDDAPERCVETHTCVVATTLIGRFSPGTRQFIEQNYLPVDEDLRVAGLVLRAATENPRSYKFRVVIPASYKIISRNQNVSGVLDGTPYGGARFLAAGLHTFESTSTSSELFLLWSQAVDRHFTPFARPTSPDS